MKTRHGRSGPILDEEVKRHFLINSDETCSNRISIPIHDQSGVEQGKLSATLLVNAQLYDVRLLPTMQNESQSTLLSRVIYRLNDVEQGDRQVIVVFSVDAVWRLWKLGFPGVIAVLNQRMSLLQVASIDQVLQPQGTVWILSDRVGSSFQRGVNAAKQLSRLRHTRHVVTRSRTAVASLNDLLRVFVP